MIETDRSVDAEQLRTRLPGDWRVENGAEGAIVGYAPVDPPCSERVFAAFEVRPSKDLWTAVWYEPDIVGDRYLLIIDRVTGVKERCIEWVIEKAVDR